MILLARFMTSIKAEQAVFQLGKAWCRYGEIRSTKAGKVLSIKCVEGSGGW